MLTHPRRDALGSIDPPVMPVIKSNESNKTMKSIVFFAAAAAALLAPHAALAQTSSATTPVGYVSQTLPPNAFSFCGLTVHSPVVSTGVLTAATNNSVTHDGVNFSTLLTAGATYILELENGTIQEIRAWNSTGRLTTPENISAQITPGTTKYNLRKAKTISDVFGANNTFGLTQTSAGYDRADQIYLPTRNGLVGIYYYDDGDERGWYTFNGNPAENVPIIYSDGFYIRRVAGSPITIVTAGEIKPRPTRGVLTPGWNYMSSVFPAGLTLENSGLKNFFSISSTGAYDKVDNVYIPSSNGFIIAYYYDDGDEKGWFTAAGAPADNFKLEGGFLILSRSTTNKAITLSVPVSTN